MVKIFVAAYEILKVLYGNSLADHLFNTMDGESLYLHFGVVNIVGTLLLSGFYYYALDSPSLNRWYHWVVIVVISGVIQFLYPFVRLRNSLYGNGIDPELSTLIDISNIVGFSGVNTGYSIILMIFWSLTIRWWSTNCSTTPIPQ